MSNRSAYHTIILSSESVSPETSVFVTLSSYNTLVSELTRSSKNSGYFLTPEQPIPELCLS